LTLALHTRILVLVFGRPTLPCARLLLLLVIGFAGAGLLRAGDTTQAMKTYEGTLQTGIMAIGGETTGVILETGEGSPYELDLGSNEELRKLAEKLNGKKVVVQGDYKPRPGVEVSERRIIEVKSLEKAE
jgi:hypothetical protein